jgi:hypothetical protein
VTDKWNGKSDERYKVFQETRDRLQGNNGFFGGKVVKAQAKAVFSCEWPVRDDYGVTDCSYTVHQTDNDEYWFESNYGDNGTAFARFDGTPDLKLAEKNQPAPDKVVEDDGLVPNPGDDTGESYQAEQLFGVGFDLDTYVYNG